MNQSVYQKKQTKLLDHEPNGSWIEMAAWWGSKGSKMREQR
jgi:hypothetical protein